MKNNRKVYFYSVALLVALAVGTGFVVPSQPLVKLLNAQAVDASGLLTGQHSKTTSAIVRTIQSSNYAVLGIGEQSHGTSEFFTLRTNLLKQLIADPKITKIGLEAPMAEVEDLNQYVLHDQGDLKTILKSLRVYIYECSEFAALINEVKEINKGRVNKIILFGFDLQSPFRSLENIAALAAKDPTIPADSIKKLLHAYQLLSNQVYSHTFSENDFNEVQAMSQALVAPRPGTISLTPTEVAFRRYQTNYRQFLRLNNPGLTNWDVKPMSVIRDSLMAENVVNEVLAGEKVIILAHNAHLQKQESFYSKSMGQFIKDKLKNRYQCIGLTTASGQYTAFNPTAKKIINTNPVLPPDEQAFEYYFSRLSKPVFFLETASFRRSLKETDLPSQYRMLPMGFIEKQFVTGNVFKDFDYIIHINQTSGSHSFYLK